MLVNGLKLVVVGLVTIGIVMAPFWNKPETLKAMMERMFPVEKRELITTAATLWTFLRSYFRPIDIAQNRLMLFRMCSAMVTLSSALTLPFVLRRPRNNSVFLAAFAVCGMNTYLFGYYIHEKHLQYAYLAFLLNFVVFRRFLSIFSFVISYTLFYMGSINNNHVECLILTFSFMYMMRSFENEVRKEAKESQRLPALEDSHASALDRLVFWAYRGQARYSDHVLAGIFVALALVGAMGLTCLFIRPLRDFLEANSFYFMFDGPFLCFVYIYIFMWKALYVESTRPEEGYEPVKLK